MKIHNIRLGHACNSSSSHSIVPLAALGGLAHDDYDDGEFGWTSFMLASVEGKMQYLAATLDGRMPEAKITALTGVEPGEGGWHGPFGYVDHQSLMALPVEGPHAEQFLIDIRNYLRREDVVVLGGNDNGGRPTLAHLPIPREDTPPRIRPGYGPDDRRYWTIMEPRRGDKIRLSFDDQPLSGAKTEIDAWNDYAFPGVEAEFTIPYANAPELVDMKVTAFCPFEKDCPWCYMGSTREGEHASLEAATAWLESFKAAGVFEIALGGGEPTLWPYLNAFRAAAAEAEINVNLTTKNIGWLRQPENVTGLRAIAVSINNERDMRRLEDIELEPLRGRVELTVQCVPAFCDDALLDAIISFAMGNSLRVTFLGVKRVGRAVEEQRQDDLRWLDVLKRVLERNPGKKWWLTRGVAVDTLMAAAAAPAFEEMGVDPVWYETTEGRFSCYVDATTGTMGASSYVDPKGEMMNVPPAEFVEGFQDVQRLAGLRPPPSELGVSAEATSEQDALVNVEKAARALDALFDLKGNNPSSGVLDGVQVTEEATGLLLSLHDYLNDVTIARGAQ